MLDNSLVIYGSPMGKPNQHSHKRVPFLVAGHDELESCGDSEGAFSWE